MKEEILKWVLENEFFVDHDQATGSFVVDAGELADFIISLTRRKK